MKFRFGCCLVIYFSVSVLSINEPENMDSIQATVRTSIKPVPNYPYQTNGFNSSSVTSGPILIIDKKTIFIGNLNYHSNLTNSIEHFRVGSGAPSANGTLVPDENGSSAGLKHYSARNIYLRLPDNSTTDTIDYLGIWSRTTNSNIGHVMLYSNDSQKQNIPEATEFYNQTQDNKVIFRVPKCCELNQFLVTDFANCTHGDIRDSNIKYRVFESNETHIEYPYIFMNVEFIPYYYKLDCEPNDYRWRLQDGEYGLIYNSSLIFVDATSHGIYSHGKFCMDNEEGHTETKFFVCESADRNIDSTSISKVPDFYFIFLIISTLCFFLSTICFQYILKEKDVHRKCIIGYTTWMTVTFLCLILFQKLSGSCMNCNFLGSVFMFASFSSSVWLTCLCADLLYITKSYTKYSDHTRLHYYIGLSLVIPLICVIISLIPDFIPDVPTSFIKDYDSRPTGTCLFNGQNIALFFVPIGVLLVICMALLGGTSYVIKTHDLTDCDWINNKSRFKFMLQSCLFIWIIVCVWIMEALVTHYINRTMDYIPLIEASQGIFVVLICVLNKYTRREILAVINKDHTKRKRDRDYRNLVIKLTPATPDRTYEPAEDDVKENGDEIRQQPL